MSQKKNKYAVIIFFQLIAAIGYTAFFLPWIETAYGNYSGNDIYNTTYYNLLLNWLLLFFPISFLISGITKFNLPFSVPASIIKIIELTPLILLLFFTTQIFLEIDNDSNNFVFQEDTSESIGIGLYLTFSASIVIIFAPLRKYVNTNS